MEYTRWFARPAGMAVIAYVAITAALGVWFLVASRAAGARTAAPTVRAVPAVPPGIELIAADDPALGPPDAPLTIVEFSDFQCPFCRRSFPIIREVAARYGDRVRYVYRDFPVDDVHPEARGAAIAAQCAHAQEKFWPYHDRLFQQQEALDSTSLSAYASAVGLDVVAFERCRAGTEAAQKVEEDATVGKALGIRGTPTWFFVPDGDAQRAQRVEGVIPRDALIGFIEATFPL